MPIRTCLETRLSEITAISEKNLIKPPIPVPAFIAEAYTLYEACRIDREELCSVGLDWNIAEDLPHRVLACLAAYGRWRASQTVITPLEQEYRQRLQQAWEMLKEIQEAVLYASRVRGNKLPARMKPYTQRPEDKILIQALSIWTEYADSVKADLASIRFDMRSIESAGRIVKELGAVTAKFLVEAPYADVELLKDQAFTWLYNAVDAIRAAGKHVFRNRPEKRKAYESEYRRLHRNTRSKRQPKNDPQNTEAIGQGT